MKSKIVALFAGSLLFFSCRGQEKKEIAVLEPSEFAQKLKTSADAQVIDVRTSEEFQQQHLDKAVNIDWYEQENFARQVSHLDKSKPVFVYCMAGSRSKKAASVLAQNGFTEVYDLKGGIVRWNAQGLSGDGPTTKIEGLCPTEFTELTASADKVLIDFYAPWCEPCKRMAPYLEKMASEDTSIKIVRLNADEQKTMSRELDISELPLLLFYENGKEKWSHKGFLSEQDLKSKIK